MSPIAQPGSDGRRSPQPDDSTDDSATEDLDAHDSHEVLDQPQAQTGRSRWLLLTGVAATVFLADQLTKWWVLVTMDKFEEIHIVWTLQLKLVENPGAAFSLAAGRGVPISVAALVAVAILLRAGRRTANRWSLAALGLIVGGALGNLADRAFRDGEGFMGGRVIDFIDLQWWPIFNIADMGVVVGAGLLIATSWNSEPPRRAAGRPSQAGD